MNERENMVLKCPYCGDEIVGSISKKGKDDMAKGKKSIFVYICRKCSRVVKLEFNTNPRMAERKGK